VCAVDVGGALGVWPVAGVAGVIAMAMLLFGGADCVPESGIGEAAACCDCLADFAPDGRDASFSRGNCLPTVPGLPNLGISDERQVCAEAAGQSLQGADSAVDVVAACLEDDHPCDDPCALAAANGVAFDPQ
jgi:hypothetical protein